MFFLSVQAPEGGGATVAAEAKLRVSASQPVDIVARLPQVVRENKAEDAGSLNCESAQNLPVSPRVNHAGALRSALESERRPKGFRDECLRGHLRSQ